MLNYDEGQVARVADRRVAIASDFDDIDHALDFTTTELDMLYSAKWYYEGVLHDHDF